MGPNDELNLYVDDDILKKEDLEQDELDDLLIPEEEWNDLEE